MLKFMFKAEDRSELLNTKIWQ